MTAQPIDHEGHHGDLQRVVRELADDPELLWAALPERERPAFLAAYRQAADGARDLAGFKNLRRVLRLWSFRAIAVNRPGYYEDREQSRNGVHDGGALLADVVAELRGEGG